MNFGDARLPQRFWDKCVPVPFAGCWLWMAATGSGYGQIQWRDGLRRYRRRSVHRVTYEALVGAIPDGLTIDHKCEVKTCCNPAHLEPVSFLENTRRYRERHPYTGCLRGHAVGPGTGYVNGGGFYVCKECHKARMVEYRARVRARLVAA